MKRNPFVFFQEVKSELAKVTWPTRNETLVTTIMVFIMVFMAAVFFLVADTILSSGISFVLGLRW
ncbi:MAG: preprotein translocase subunit SecE [Hyphomicrobiales bacterium]|nr:preprotein translocase subunit SecE [Hyphomicrobiales bacterium]MCY4048867.1 preprotein translocase subunit SecE [Hyphomicrobiales bacterium]